MKTSVLIGKVLIRFGLAFAIGWTIAIFLKALGALP